MTKRHRGYYRELFFAHNGLGPYTCFFCNEDIPFNNVFVHHENHDKSDDRIENLKPSHGSCHTRHHQTGATPYTRTEAHKENMRKVWSDRLSDGYVVSEETRQKISQSKKGKPPPNKGIPHSEETKRKMKEAWAKRRESGLKRSPEHQAKLTESQKGRKASDDARRNMSEAAKRRHNPVEFGGDGV